MLGVGRDLCGSSSPTLLLKQGHLQQAAQDLVQVGHSTLGDTTLFQDSTERLFPGNTLWRVKDSTAFSDSQQQGGLKATAWHNIK